MNDKRVIAAMRNLKVEEPITWLDSTASLVKNFEYLEGVDHRALINNFGYLGYRDFEEYPVFNIEMEDVTLETIPSISSLVKLLSFSMWLVKDHAVNVTELIGLDPSENRVISSKNNRISTKSDGSFEKVEFSKKDFEDVINWMFEVAEYFYSDTELKPLKDGEFVNQNNVNLSKMDRYSRAIYFIIIARGEASLHAKVTYYISAMEALLCNSVTELRMQVAERSARLLGDSKEEKLRIYDIVSIAYSFRSQYVHASSAKRKLKFLKSEEELGTELDLIVRNLLKNLINKHPQINEASDKDFNNWVRQYLLFD